MSKLPQVKARHLVKIARKLGFVFNRQAGSHAIYTHPDGRRTTIPVHPSKNIGIGLLNAILDDDFEITREEFLKLLKK